MKPLLDVLYDGVVSTIQYFCHLLQSADFGIPGQDCDDLCVWCHLFREDPYDARYSYATWYHPSRHACAYGRGHCGRDIELSVTQEILHRPHPDPSKKLSFNMSYFEIYKDEVYDLLVDRETVGCWSISRG